MTDRRRLCRVHEVEHMDDVTAAVSVSAFFMRANVRRLCV